MATIVHEGHLRVPVRYEDWVEWRDTQRDALPPAPLIAEQSASCAHCWGQGRVLSPAGNGEGLVPRACATCGGSGLVVLGPA